MTACLSISVPLMGAVYDITGSYRLAWYGLFLCSIAIAFSLIGSESCTEKAVEIRSLTEESFDSAMRTKGMLNVVIGGLLDELYVLGLAINERLPAVSGRRTYRAECLIALRLCLNCWVH